MPSAVSTPPGLTTGRLAPSPTGGLHIGHARTFLIAWLAARAEGGRVILRIEDLDASRSRPEAITSSILDLRWLGLDWDEGPDVGGPHGSYLQSERTEIYDDAMKRLREAELVYPCTCTRAEIERAASAPHAEDESPPYPKTCANRSAEDAESLGDRPFGWRFRVPDASIDWVDQFGGPQTAHSMRTGGDFLVGRNGQGAGYQLAVVVDDALMQVDQVVRGDDLIPSTPRQLLLYEALGWRPPVFTHIPLVLGEDGRRLAKRDGSIKLATLRERGIDPKWLIGVLAQSCGWSSDLVPSHPRDWIEAFTLSSIPRTPWTATLM